MTGNYVQEGKIMDYVNDTGSDISSGDGVVASSQFGVAITDIADTKTGSVAIVGVYKLAKINTEAFAQGEKVYWNSTNKQLTTTATGNKVAGHAFEAALTADTEATVNLNKY